MILPLHFYPYWTVYDELGQKYCDCSHEKYAVKTVWLHAEYENKTFTYKKINSPKPLPPHIVDVKAETEGELPGQVGLPKATERLHDDMREKLKQSSLEEIIIND